MTSTSCLKWKDLLPSSTKEQIISKPKPTRLFREVASEFCSYATPEYCVLVDCCSDLLNIIPMGYDTTASHLIKVVRQSFCRTGVPNTFWSDKGSEFTATNFCNFARVWGFTHIPSTPRYPPSSGKIEATVKSTKNITRMSWNGRHLNEVKSAAPSYNIETRLPAESLSLAQKLYGRPVKDTV